nr:hypothetical protein GCM10020092_071780 [Actinoplanes digitatis]
MSFYIDPWLYNCVGNPADTAEQQAEQRAIIQGMKRALSYAHRRGVTLVGALGNNNEDLGKPRTDTSSPDYPADAAKPRPIDNDTCWDLPVEGPHVIGVSSVGPTGQKADYSNYGREQISVAAPGGWFRDGFGTPAYRTNGNMILSSYPVKVLKEQGKVDAAKQHHRLATRRPSSRNAPPLAPAATTRTCRAPRWPRRTPPGWRR